MSATDVYDRFIVLRDGGIAPAPAFVLLLDFEARGIQLTRDGDTLLVGPADQLTDDDRAAIRRWKPHLLMLLAYATRTDLDAHLFTDRTPREAQHA